MFECAYFGVFGQGLGVLKSRPRATAASNRQVRSPINSVFRECFEITLTHFTNLNL